MLYENKKVTGVKASGNAPGVAMNDGLWSEFFVACAKTLGEGERGIGASPNWCSWTTFSRLREDAGYWQCGLPHMNELWEKGTTDGGTWSQPFLFADIAHLIVPKIFTRELFVGEDAQKTFQRIRITQDIEALSRELVVRGVPHVLTPMGLEMRGVFKVDPNDD